MIKIRGDKGGDRQFSKMSNEVGGSAWWRRGFHLSWIPYKTYHSDNIIHWYSHLPGTIQLQHDIYSVSLIILKSRIPLIHPPNFRYGSSSIATKYSANTDRFTSSTIYITDGCRCTSESLDTAPGGKGHTYRSLTSNANFKLALRRILLLNSSP